MTVVDHPLEFLLRQIGAAAPVPWRPLAYIQASESNPEYVRRLVELLRLEGLIEVGPGEPNTGPEVRLTPLGVQVLADPEAMARLRAGAALRPDDPGAVVREAVRNPTRPVITPLLLGLNLAVFAYCLHLANADRALFRAFLSGSPSEGVVNRVLQPAGGVSPVNLIEGQWWRLLTACFVHGGALHLLMNMYTLYVAGRFIEQVWGSWRFLLIYLIGGWGGSCLALAWSPTLTIQGQTVLITTVGASGALCGMLAAEGAWVLLYGRYLPREMAARGRSQLMVTILLMVVISFLPGISGWGHAGGALAGLAAALVLHWQRFGPAVMRWLGVLLVVPLPLLSYWHLQYERRHSTAWRKADDAIFWGVIQPRFLRAEADAADRYRDAVREVLEADRAERDQEAVATALKALDEIIPNLEQLQRRLAAAGPFGDKQTDQLRELMLSYTGARLALCEGARDKLKAGADWTREQEKDFQAREAAMERAKEAWKNAEFTAEK